MSGNLHWNIYWSNKNRDRRKWFFNYHYVVFWLMHHAECLLILPCGTYLTRYWDNPLLNWFWMLNKDYCPLSQDWLCEPLHMLSFVQCRSPYQISFIILVLVFLLGFHYKSYPKAFLNVNKGGPSWKKLNIWDVPKTCLDLNINIPEISEMKGVETFLSTL